MEAINYKIPRQKTETVRVEYWDLPYFYEPIHFHEECQLTFILESKGTLLVGDKLDRFCEGELYLFGPNLPHVFRNDTSYFKSNNSAHARAITVFFLMDTISAMVDNIPEANNIKNLLINSDHGIRLTNKNAEKIVPFMKKLLKLNGLQKVFELIIAINHISFSKNIEIISSKIPLKINEEDNLKLNKVFDYIHVNHRERISLQEVAGLVFMTPTSFCRYFKKRTQKTFSQYLTEVRISNACKFLSEKKYNVSESSYLSGYNNISNFHRHFATLMGMTPNKYRQEHVASFASAH